MTPPTHGCVCGAVAWKGGEETSEWVCNECGEVCPCYPTGAPSLRWMSRKLQMEAKAKRIPDGQVH